MKKRAKWLRRLGIMAVVLASGLAAGCDDDDDYDHDVPAGQGSLVVDNFTADRVRVYVDGEKRESVGDGDHRYYDLAPGVHRVALDGDDTDRSWADDVDVLEGRLTVLEVRSAAFEYDDFDVRIYFD